MRVQLRSQWGAVPVALAGSAVIGFAVARHGRLVLALCVAVAAALALALLGRRAFAWALVAVSVAPWYQFIATSALPPRVPQKVLAAAIAAGPLVPLAWSLAFDRRPELPRSAWTLLVGTLYAAYAVIIYSTVGALKPMVQSGTIGFLFGGVTLLCARRFDDSRAWLAASFGGLVALLGMGFAVRLAAPGNRIGYFTGYPITYGALVVGLLPAAVLFAARRSRLLALAVVILSGLALLWSESRSSWIAVAVILLLVIAVLARIGELRALALVTGATVLLIGVIFATGSLRHLVERKLSSGVVTSDSFTHRTWSFSFGMHQVTAKPVLGHGAPGYAGQLAATATGIGAVDNGYLSITIDMGVLGLVGAVLPIVLALVVLARSLLRRRAPAAELAMSLGIIGMAVVTAFYDSFYWASIMALMAGMAGLLSTRLGSGGASAAAVPSPGDRQTVHA